MLSAEIRVVNILYVYVTNISYIYIEISYKEDMYMDPPNLSTPTWTRLK